MNSYIVYIKSEKDGVINIGINAEGYELSSSGAIKFFVGQDLVAAFLSSNLVGFVNVKNVAG